MEEAFPAHLETLPDFLKKRPGKSYGSLEKEFIETQLGEKISDQRFSILKGYLTPHSFKGMEALLKRSQSWTQYSVDQTLECLVNNREDAVRFADAMLFVVKRFLQSQEDLCAEEANQLADVFETTHRGYEESKVSLKRDITLIEIPQDWENILHSYGITDAKKLLWIKRRRFFYQDEWDRCVIGTFEHFGHWTPTYRKAFEEALTAMKHDQELQAITPDSFKILGENVQTENRAFLQACYSALTEGEISFLLESAPGHWEDEILEAYLENQGWTPYLPCIQGALKEISLKETERLVASLCERIPGLTQAKLLSEKTENGFKTQLIQNVQDHLKEQHPTRRDHELEFLAQTLVDTNQTESEAIQALDAGLPSSEKQLDTFEIPWPEDLKRQVIFEIVKTNDLFPVIQDHLPKIWDKDYIELLKLEGSLDAASFKKSVDQAKQGIFYEYGVPFKELKDEKKEEVARLFPQGERVWKKELALALEQKLRTQFIKSEASKFKVWDKRSKINDLNKKHPGYLSALSRFMVDHKCDSKTALPLLKKRIESDWKAYGPQSPYGFSEEQAQEIARNILLGQKDFVTAVQKVLQADGQERDLFVAQFMHQHEASLETARAILKEIKDILLTHREKEGLLGVIRENGPEKVQESVSTFLCQNFPDYKAHFTPDNVQKILKGSPIPSFQKDNEADIAVAMLDVHDLLDKDLIGVSQHQVTEEKKKNLVLFLQTQHQEGEFNLDFYKWMLGGDLAALTLEDIAIYYRKANDNLMPDALLDKWMTAREQQKVSSQERFQQLQQRRSVVMDARNPCHANFLNWTNEILFNAGVLHQGQLPLDPYFKPQVMPEKDVDTWEYNRILQVILDYVGRMKWKDFPFKGDLGGKKAVKQGIRNLFNWGDEESTVLNEEKKKRWRQRIKALEPQFLTSETLNMRTVGLMATQGRQCIDASRNVLTQLEIGLSRPASHLTVLERLSHHLSIMRTEKIMNLASAHGGLSTQREQPEYGVFMMIACAESLSLHTNETEQTFFGKVDLSEKVHFQEVLSNFCSWYTPNLILDEVIQKILKSVMKPTAPDPGSIYLDEWCAELQKWEPWCNLTTEQLTRTPGPIFDENYEIKREHVRNFLRLSGYIP